MVYLVVTVLFLCAEGEYILVCCSHLRTGRKDKKNFHFESFWYIDILVGWGGRGVNFCFTNLSCTRSGTIPRGKQVSICHLQGQVNPLFPATWHSYTIYKLPYACPGVVRIKWKSYLSIVTEDNETNVSVTRRDVKGIGDCLEVTPLALQQRWIRNKTQIYLIIWKRTTDTLIWKMISNYSKICDKHVRSIQVLNLK